MRVSLAQTGEWLHRLGSADTLALRTPDSTQLSDLMDKAETDFGPTTFIKPVAQLSATPGYWMPPNRT